MLELHQMAQDFRQMTEPSAFSMPMSEIGAGKVELKNTYGQIR